MADPALRPAPPLPRRRILWWLGAAAAIAAQAALVALALRPPTVRELRTVEHVVHEVRAPAPPMTCEAPETSLEIDHGNPSIAPAPLDGARTCPVPITTARRVTPPELADDVTDVRPSPNDARYIAAWNDEHVFASLDGGRTFERVLDGPGAVLDVAFDCFGNVVVARDDALGIRADGRERWQSVPGLAFATDDPRSEAAVDARPRFALLGGGPDVVLVGPMGPERSESRVAISRDLGTSWSYRDLGPLGTWGGWTGWQRIDGTIDLARVLDDCMHSMMIWTRIRGVEVDVAQELTSGAEYEVYDGDVVITSEGWRPRREEMLRPIEGLPPEAPIAPVRGRRAIVVANHEAYAVGRGRARPLNLVVEGDRPHADAAGRIWTIHEHQPRIARRLRAEDRSSATAE